MDVLQRGWDGGLSFLGSSCCSSPDLKGAAACWHEITSILIHTGAAIIVITRLVLLLIFVYFLLEVFFVHFLFLYICVLTILQIFTNCILFIGNQQYFYNLYVFISCWMLKLVYIFCLFHLPFIHWFPELQDKARFHLFFPLLCSLFRQRCFSQVPYWKFKSLDMLTFDWTESNWIELN